MSHELREEEERRIQDAVRLALDRLEAAQALAGDGLFLAAAMRAQHAASKLLAAHALLAECAASDVVEEVEYVA